MLKSRSFIVGAVIIIIFTLLAIFGAIFLPEHWITIDPFLRLQSASEGTLLGRDHYGRDMAAMMIAGAEVTMIVGLSVVFISGLLGLFFGLVAGYIRVLDNVIMRVMDGMMAFPGVLLALGIMAAIGPRLENIIIALSVVQIPRLARLIRGSVLVLRESTFVESAVSLGAGSGRIIIRHILPNSLNLFIVQASFVFARAVLSEAALSFLGVGVPPDVITWGSMLSEGRPFMLSAPWLTIYPGFAIMLTVLGLNLIGDGLRDSLDPKTRRQLQ